MSEQRPLLSSAVEPAALPPACFSVEEAVAHIGFGRFQWRLLFLSGSTLIADATELLLVSFLSDELTCFWGISPAEATALQTAVFVGMLAGALFSGDVADAHGRRTAFFATTALIAAAGLASAAAPTLGFLIACRFCAGLGIGGTPAALTLYTEFLPARARGAKLILFFCFFSVGALAEALLAWGTLQQPGGWRLLLTLSALPSVALLLAYPWLPESPRWLLLRGREAEALQLFRAASAMNGVPPLPCSRLTLVSAGGGASVAAEGERGGGSPLELDALGAGNHLAARAGGGADAVAHSPATRADRMRLLCSPSLRRTTALLSAMYFLMALLYYAVVLLNNRLVNEAAVPSASSPPATSSCGSGPAANASSPSEAVRCSASTPSQVCRSQSDFVGIVVANAAELPGLAVAWLLLDLLGRPHTIAAFFFSTAAAIALLLLLPLSARVGAVGVFIIAAARASCIGFNQSLWVATTELFPTSVRGSGLGFTTAFARVGGMLSPLLVNAVFDASRDAGLGVCIAVALVAGALSLLLPAPRGSFSIADF